MFKFLFVLFAALLAVSCMASPSPLPAPAPLPRPVASPEPAPQFYTPLAYGGYYAAPYAYYG